MVPLINRERRKPSSSHLHSLSPPFPRVFSLCLLFLLLLSLSSSALCARPSDDPPRTGHGGPPDSPSPQHPPSSVSPPSSSPPSHPISPPSPTLPASVTSSPPPSSLPLHDVPPPPPPSSTTGSYPPSFPPPSSSLDPLDPFLQDIVDAQQELRQADLEAALSTGGAAPAIDPFVEASQHLIDPAEESSGLAGGSSDSPAQGEAWDEAEQLEWEETEDFIDGLFHQAEALLSNSDSSKADVAEAMSLMQRAAALGSSEADEELGMAHLYGDLLPRNLTLAHQHFQSAADDGIAAAQHSLAFLYSMHLVPTPSTWPSAVPHATPLSVLFDYMAAAGGHVGAKMTMGYRHLYGYGVPKSCETAASYYRDVAQLVVDDFSSQAHHQLQAIDRAHLSDESSRSSHLEDSAEVLQYYQHSAEGGNVEAQLTMGQLHYYGHRGLPHSPQLAAKYFTQAAAAGDSNAMTNLGQMHLNGLIDTEGEHDGNVTALQLFQAAAEQGNPHAQTSLGMLYLTGGVVPVNYTLAYHYFFQANKRGHPEAQFRLGVMHFTGLGVEAHMGQAYLYFTASAFQGHVRSLFNVAQMETHGLGVVKDCKSGVEKLKAVSERGDWSEDLGEGHELFLQGEYEKSWLMYALAAHEGQEVGQSNAAWMIDRQYVSSLWGKDLAPPSVAYDVAYSLFHQSAEQKNYDSWRMMGDYAYYQFIHPSAVPRASLPTSNTSQPHLALAASHYAKACEKNAQAAFDLGYMYHYGLGVQRDYHLAKRYYDMAVTIDPNALVPCKLALIQLWIEGEIEEWRDWWEGRGGGESEGREGGGGEEGESAGGKVGGRKGVEGGRTKGVKGGAGGEGVGWVGGVMERVFGVDVGNWGWFEWYEWCENAVLVVSVGALAVCIYYRAQRM